MVLDHGDAPRPPRSAAPARTVGATPEPSPAAPRRASTHPAKSPRQSPTPRYGRGVHGPEPAPRPSWSTAGDTVTLTGRGRRMDDQQPGAPDRPHTWMGSKETGFAERPPVPRDIEPPPGSAR
ncbi:hypothetical protein [Streptomyces sp. NPDC018059]|uniref:hypothetical protein n=1 Tax=Streptomyces sp. NPDC018059 TaxID=3365041 RepID=UPI003789A349